MKPPDTILLPIDTRNCPLEAFSYINQFASHHRTVILLHVVNLNVVPPDGRVFDDLSRAAEKNLLRLSERFLDRRFFVRHQIRFGRPAVEILKEAREFNVDLITLTCHGTNSLWRHPFGSRTVGKVLRSAPCDVMLLYVRTQFNCDEDWDRTDEIVSGMEHAGLLRVQAHPGLNSKLAENAVEEFICDLQSNDEAVGVWNFLERSSGVNFDSKYPHKLRKECILPLLRGGGHT
jgi:nucleotide-binding universal stress UspA family protein